MNDPVQQDVPLHHPKDHMTESKPRKSSSHDASSWDAQAFDQKVKSSKEFKGTEKKTATRVQDISMSLVSGHEPRQNKESWPFDSSPCRMFGGKNTKPEGAVVNKELFKTEFGEIQKESKTDSEESELLHDVSSDSSSDDDDDDDDANSFGEESETIEIEVEIDVTEQKKKPDPPATSILKRERTIKRETPARNASTKSTHSMDSNESGESRERNKTKSPSKTNAQRPMRRSLRRSDSDRRLTQKKSSRDSLGVSCHPNIETKNNRRSTTTTTSGSSKKSSGLGAATTHDGVRSSRRSRNLARVKSSDGLEMRGPPSRGSGLGPTVSFHGEDELTRKSRRSDRKSSKDHRGRLTRAMSTHNVRPPEHHSTGKKSSHSERRERTIAPNVTPEQPSKKTSSSRPGVKRNSSSHSKSMNRSNSSRRLKSDGDESDASVVSRRNGTKRASKRGTSTTSEEPTKAAPPPEAPHRDLLVLLREQKTVEPSDLLDKDNRRLLHFLAYEHKMGINIKELRRSVSADA